MNFAEVSNIRQYRESNHRSHDRKANAHPIWPTGFNICLFHYNDIASQHSSDRIPLWKPTTTSLGVHNGEVLLGESDDGHEALGEVDLLVLDP